jgi:hypothetical protein
MEIRNSSNHNPRQGRNAGNEAERRSKLRSQSSQVAWQFFRASSSQRRQEQDCGETAKKPESLSGLLEKPLAAPTFIC